MKDPVVVMEALRAANPRPDDGPQAPPPRDLLDRITAEDPVAAAPPRRGRLTGRSTGAIAVALVLLGGGALAAAWGTGNLPGAPGSAPPERVGVRLPGATHAYDVPVPALGGVSPDGYSTLAEADGIIAAAQRGTASGRRCVLIATASGAVTRGCWRGALKPGVLVWAFDEVDGTQAVAFGTDTRAATARVGRRTFPVPAGSDIAVVRLRRGEAMPIDVRHGNTRYTVAFPGGTATR